MSCVVALTSRSQSQHTAGKSLSPPSYPLSPPPLPHRDAVMLGPSHSHHTGHTPPSHSPCTSSTASSPPPHTHGTPSQRPCGAPPAASHHPQRGGRGERAGSTAAAHSLPRDHLHAGLCGVQCVRVREGGYRKHPYHEQRAPNRTAQSHDYTVVCSV